MKRFLFFLVVLTTMPFLSVYSTNGSIYWITIRCTVDGSIEQFNIDPSQGGLPEITMDEGGDLEVELWQENGSAPFKYAVWGYSTGYYDEVVKNGNTHTFYLSDNDNRGQRYTVWVDNDDFDFKIIEQNNSYIYWVTVHRTINGVVDQYDMDPSQSGIPEIYMDEGGYLDVEVWQGGGSAPFKYAVWGYSTGYYDEEIKNGNSHTFYLSDHNNRGQQYTVWVDDDEFDFKIIEQSFNPITADFSSNAIEGTVPLTVQFMDESDGSPTSWAWDFDSDGVVDSDIENPEWTYSQVGTFSVSLTVSDGTYTDNEIKTDYITIGSPADMSAISGNISESDGTPIEGVTISLSDGSVTSTDANGDYLILVNDGYTGNVIPTKADWAFQPATNYYSNLISDMLNENYVGEYNYVYQDIRVITIQNTTINGVTQNGSAPQFTIYKGESIVGTFSVHYEHNQPESHVIPLAATPNWGNKINDFWTVKGDISNGSITNGNISLVAPDTEGTYYIIIAAQSEYNAAEVLSATSWHENSPVWNDGNDIFDLSGAQLNSAIDNGSLILHRLDGTYNNTVYGITAIELNVIDQPILADFSVNTINGDVPLTVQFENLTTGNASSWQWDFDNDGVIDSNLENPEWTYPLPGTYTVTLIAANTDDQDTLVKEEYIEVNPVQHFYKIWDGNPHNPMMVIVSAGFIQQNNLQPDDEIGIFDADRCVGSIVLSQIIDSLNNNTYAYITCSSDDPDQNGYDGFVPGNEVEYRLWDSSEQEEYTVVDATYPHDPLYKLEQFTENETSIVQLNGLRTSTLFQIADAAACQGDTLRLEIHTEGMHDVDSLALSITYDASKLQYVSCSNVNSAITSNSVAANSGQIDFIGTGTDMEVPMGSLFTLNFVSQPGQSGSTDTEIQGSAWCYRGSTVFAWPTSFENGNALIRPLPHITQVNTVPVSGCHGDANGEISITATANTTDIYYSINAGDTWALNQSNFTNLVASEYTITVKDTFACQSDYESNPVTITEPTAVAITEVVTTEPLCYGSGEGSITITATGGTGALQYSIDNGANWQNGNQFASLTAGDYNIAVKDENDCQTAYANNPVTISEPTAVAISEVTTTEPLCYGSNEGSITITATGGTGALQYSIDNGANWQAGNQFASLTAGDYNITVKDENDCQTAYANNPVTISEPTVVAISEVTTTEPLCNGSNEGTIAITATGGTGTLQYSIDNGANWQAGNQFASLTAGDYNITVKDENDCQTSYANNPVTITEPTAVAITEVTTTEPLCNGSNEGSITITASGGTGTLQYSIDNGANWQAGNQFASLTAGDYNITVKDENDCQTAYANNPVTITEPTAVAITEVTSTEPLCNGSNEGSITITATGGTGTLQYSIDNGANWQAGNQFASLTAGDYNITVKDENDCQTTYTNNPVTISEPTPIEILEVSFNKETYRGASDASISINAAGGTEPLQYSVDGGFSWFSNEGLFTDLDSGDYNISVRDANLCEHAYVNNPVIIPGVHFDRAWSGNPLNPMYFSITHAMAEEMNLEWMDEIAIYDGNICVGTVVLTQSIDSLNNTTYAAINCSQDDNGTPQKEGYTPGHAIHYRMWDESSQEEYIYVQDIYPFTPEFAFEEFAVGETDIVQLYGQVAVEQTMDLTEGWNIISWNVVPLNNSMDSLLDPVISDDNLLKAIDEQGNIIQELPWGWVNMIGDMQQTEGYQVKVNTATTFATNGYAVLMPMDIPFYPSWNIMSWPMQTSGDAENAMQEIINQGKLVKVIDQSGGILQQLPWGWVNTIGDFEPGQGYQVKVSGNCTLNLDETAGDYKSYSMPQPQARMFRTAGKGNPYNPMTFAIQSNRTLPQNSEIGVYKNGQCFGAAVLTGEYIYISAGTDEADTEEKEGFTPGDAFTFKYITEGMQEPRELEVTWLQGDKTYTERGTFVGEIKSITAAEELQATASWISEARPNPARDEVFVDCYLNADASLSWQMVDAQGRVLLQGQKESPQGRHQQRLDLSTLPSGIYYLHLKAEGEGMFKEKVLRIVRL